MEEDKGGRLYQRSFLSKTFGFISFVFLIFGIFQFVTLNLTKGIISIVLSLVIAYPAYRLAGGKRNPALWRDKDSEESK